MTEGPVDPFATPAEPDPFTADQSATALAEEIVNEAADPERDEQPNPDSPAPTVEIPTVDADGNVIEPEVSQEADEPVGAPEGEATPQEPPEAAQDATPAPSLPPEAAVVAAQAEAVAPAPADPAPPASRPPGPRGGKGEMRHYKLLYVSGNGQLTIADLSQVPDDSGITVVKLPKDPNEKESRPVPGDVQELWFEARNNEHANRLGFAIMGRPKDGVHIFAVPRGAWKPRFVKPAPPAPARERVVIS